MVSAKIPPIADSGIAVNISKPCLTDLKAKYKRIKIKSKAIGTAIDNLDFACSKFSN